MCREGEGRWKQPRTPGAEVNRTENERGCFSCRSNGDSTLSTGNHATREAYLVTG